VDTIGICHRVTEGTEDLRARVAPRERSGMQQTWKISGLYFDWEMTVRVEAAKSSPLAIGDDELRRALARMGGVDGHFVETVNLHEYSLENSANRVSP
jgi:hypothetical protein